MKCLKRTSSSIAVLTHHNSTYESHQEKADVLNYFFTTCFNNSVALLHAFESVDPTGQTVPADVLCEEEEVADMLRALDITKAIGQDGILTRMLKSTVAAIAPSMCRLVTQPEVLRGLESLGIVYIVTEGAARGTHT